jgi:two-component system, OmpR family, sensor histidine kinase KdpD
VGSSGARGELRTYLGIAPGVGKTYDMFRDGRAKRRSGVDAVVAYWERHGRAATSAQIGELEVLPTKTTTYRGTSFEELDLEGVLERRPELAIVDELAHANLPGARHEKRWQDVDELLANGIAVYTTLNLGNLESLRELISKITGARPAEPVPDAFVRSGEIKLVNLEPAALRRRLTQGLVFPKDRVDTALSNYFHFANLAALQELAQLWLDDAVPDPVATYRRLHHAGEVHGAEVILVGLDGSPKDEWLISYAEELAQTSRGTVIGVHVRSVSPRRENEQIAADRRLLEKLGGRLVEIKSGDIASALIRAAHKERATQLVIGSPSGSRWMQWLRGFTVGQVLRAAGDLPVQVVNVGQPKPTNADEPTA